VERETHATVLSANDMNSFTPTMRSSLLLSAKKGDTLRRWSIKGLLKLNNVNAANAQSVLQEIRTRLAMQHQRLASFSRVEEYAKIASTVEGREMVKCIKMLLQLHENTYILPHEIIESDFFDRFSNRPMQVYLKDLVEQIMTRHGNSVETFADAIIASRLMENQIPSILRSQFRVDADILRNPEAFLHSRLLIQLICEHYVSLCKGKPFGAVSIDADILDIVDDATIEAKHVCDANLGIAPEVQILLRHQRSAEGQFVPPPVIRSWLHHAIVEVTKNGMLSTIEKWEQQSLQHKEPLPPNILIEVSRDTDFMLIRVVDNGVGLNADRSEKAFRFAASSMKQRWDRLDEQQSYATVRQPLGSLGVGLPLSNLMLKCFGGDLSLTNNESISGCTATLKVSYNDDYKALN
jgi:pyruvate dehydrogenase kinase 2/3/4